MGSLLQQMDKTDDVTSLCKLVTLLDTIQWLVKSWRDVNASTIQKCFLAAGFQSVSETPDNFSDFKDDNVLIALLVKQFQFQLDNLVTVDDDIATEDNGDQWEDDLVTSYTSTDDIMCQGSDDDESALGTSDQPGIACDLTTGKILKFYKRLMSYSLQVESSFISLANDLKTMTEKTIVHVR